MSPDVPIDSSARWANVRRTLLVAYSVALVWSIFVWGLPIDRLLVLSWMAVAFGLGTVGRPFAEVKQTARDWCALVAIYIVYDYSRGMADQLGRPVNYTWLPRIDRFIFLGRDPNVFMQWHFLRTEVQWYDVVGSIVYMTHFVLPVVPLALLRVRNRTAWLQYLRRFGLTLYIAVACFIVFPSAPPWMTAKAGYTQPVARITGRGWWVLHLKTISKTLDRGAAVMNSVAAMPSLHSGCALLITLWLTRNLPWRKRAPFLLFPVVMATTLVYFGEHYFIDAVAGWLLVLVAWQIAEWWEKRKGLESPPSLFSRGSAPRTEQTPTA